MKAYNVDFVYKTYHMETIFADSPEEALDKVADLTYGVEPDWKPDKEFLKDTQHDDYEGVSVEASVECQFVWWVEKCPSTLDDIYEDPYPECYDSYEEAEAAIGDDENCQTVEQTIKFDKTEYQMPCKFLEKGGITVELNEQYILAMLPLLKHAIEGGQDSVSARVAYNRLLSALEGEDYKGYDPSRELDFYKVEQS